MSVLLSYANKDVAIIACDGRVVDNNNNIVDESYKKYIKINDKVIIGYAGNVSACESVVSLLCEQKNAPILKQLNYENIYNFIKQYCTTFPKNINYNFIILGIGKNNQIASSHITHTNVSEIEYLTDDLITYQGIYPKELQEADVFRTYLSAQDPLLAMRSTIQYCSLHSPSVNNNIYFDFVRIDHSKENKNV